jgi:hypothetical protein
MRIAPPLSAAVVTALLGVGACAHTPYQLAARRITPPQWDEVVECVTMAAQANGSQARTSDWAVSFAIPVRQGWRMEDIQFIWGPHNVPGYTVKSHIVVTDERLGREPMEGATQETRRLRQQVDQQCLNAYPVANSARAS